MILRKRQLFVLLSLFTCISLFAAHKKDGKLTADGPYIIYNNDGSVRIISVNNEGAIVDNTMDKLPSGYKFNVVSADGKHHFSVGLHDVSRPNWDYAQSGKTFVCSDPHGNFDCFVSLLQGNGIIDKNYYWTFGKNHLIVEGDVFDRGEDVLPIFWLIYKLEAEAEKVGGHVSFILGNHEPLCLMNDIRYTEDKYKLLAEKLGMSFNEMWSPETELGHWLVTRNAMMRVGRNLFVHAGLGSEFYNRNLSVDSVNYYASRGLYKKKADRKADGDMTYFMHGSYGPIWYRGLVYKDEKYNPVSSDTLDLILNRYDADRVFIGHTIFDDISTFYNGRVVAVNVNNAKNREHNRGRAVMIEGDQITIVGDNGPKRSLKRPLTIDDIRNWRRISHRYISNNGLWVAVATEIWYGDGDPSGSVAPYSGDGIVTVYDGKGTEMKNFYPVKNFKFSASGNYAVVTTKESLAAQKERGLKEQNGSKKSKGKSSKGKKPEESNPNDSPADTLWIYSIGKNCEEIDSLRNFKLSSSEDWIAYQIGKKDSTLYVRTLGNEKSYEFKNVKEYGFAEKAATLYFLTSIDKTTTLNCIDLASQQTPKEIKRTNGSIAHVYINEDASQLAFLCSNVAKPEDGAGMSLWYTDLKAGKDAEMLTDSVNAAFSKDWVVSPRSNLGFSKDGKRLFFNVAPLPSKADTTILLADRPNVQVWSWNEPEQYTAQEYNKKRDSNKTFDAVIDLDNNKIVQICDKQFDRAGYSFDGTSRWAVISDSKPYSNSSMWEGRTRTDFYVVDLETGERRELSKADYSHYRISPSGKYAFGYAETDSMWVTVNLETLERHELTNARSFTAWDEENDVPDYPSAYGLAGWLPDDEALLIYDRYDIWKIPADGGEMVNLTKNGRTKKIQYRLLTLDDEHRGEPIDPKSMQYLQAFDETTKGSAIYRTTFQKPAEPVFLMGGDYSISAVSKAKNSDKVIFTKESFEYAPDVYYSDLKFKKPVQITHIVDQQAPFIWGTSELIKWTSYKGVQLQGLLLKPENFDPTRKYPMIVNFYERNSETLHSYRVPQPHRSTPDYHMYLSNGYIVFNPDVRYVDGHPGESAYDCVLSGIDKVLELGFVDEKHIGASGHSWGGYQLAYLATRTDRFAAIEAGAPVVNMFSAYGGIRWGSGRARAFQYEHTQSRIGASPWEAPELYTENSALFAMDKVTTPILIMHNDADGHVPWYQGIEYFVAMKRLGKPCWLLNYTGEPHWPVKMSNRFDFQTRLMQFFNHFLKGEPMPKWMKDGVKAVDQPYELGY